MNKLFLARKKGQIISLFVALFCFFSFFLFFDSCRLYNLEKKLNPVDAEFLSQVRYIISTEERKIFLELPDSEKDKFKEEFWKRRDPDLDTEENEFKMEYLNRIERANELFIGEGRPGWLTDRGRIFVQFGAPTDKLSYPMGEGPGGQCSEVWYYGYFPVLFVDQTCTGNYILYTFNLAYLQELNTAQDQFQRETFTKEKEFFDFNWSVKKIRSEADKIEGVVIIELPYDALWFKSEDNKLKTILEIQLEIRDFEKSLIWERSDVHEIAVEEVELVDKKGKDYRIEIPFLLEKDLAKLRQGKSQIHCFIKNRTGNEESRKVMEFNS